jgi:hypothetical protein
MLQLPSLEGGVKLHDRVTGCVFPLDNPIVSIALVVSPATMFADPSSEEIVNSNGEGVFSASS